MAPVHYHEGRFPPGERQEWEEPGAADRPGIRRRGKTRRHALCSRESPPSPTTGAWRS